MPRWLLLHAGRLAQSKWREDMDLFLQNRKYDAKLFTCFFQKTLHLCMLVVLAAVVAWHYGRAGVLLLLGHRDASLTKLASFSRKKLAS
jgi:hypothetical protein